MKLLGFFFSIKGPISFSQLRHDTNISSLEERRKERGGNCFLNPMLIVLISILLLHSSQRQRRWKILYKPDRVHFIDLLLNQNSTSTPFDHVPLVILEMVFSILSFRTLKPHHGGFCWETDTIECLICPVVYKIKKCHREVHIIHC